jgi:CRISPR-associated protein Cmr1
MPKVIPNCPKKPEPAQEAVQTFAVELITPMVGGGVTPGVTDHQFPVRATAIRGHLRHWWRLTVGRLLGAGMWQREEEVFGSTEFPSLLTVCVSGCSRVEQFDPSDGNLVDRFGPVAYALFASIENKHLVAKEGIKFDLTLHAAGAEHLNRRRPAQNEQRKKAQKELLPHAIDPTRGDIDTALRAWLAFGGLGGRTRRGCGAVYSKSLAGGLPKIPGRILIGKPQNSAVAAWREALQAYRDFRQTPRGRKHAKTLKSGKTVQVPGRSHWPEADSIRQITGCSLKPPAGTPPSGVPIDEDTQDHSTPVVPANLLPAFPKAVLGLPINFHFADGPGKNRPADPNLDPQGVQLYPLLPAASGKLEKVERMASPVITRPLWLDGKWHPAVVILDQPLPPGFAVRVEGKNATIRGNLSHDVPLNQILDPSPGLLGQQASRTGSPDAPVNQIVASRLANLIPMRGQANAIEALVEYLTKEQKWRKL